MNNEHIAFSERLRAALQRAGVGESPVELVRLLAEQRRTNRLLQSVLYGAIGFFLGMVVMQLVLHLRG